MDRLTPTLRKERMAIKDRRSGEERRSMNRYQVEADIEWQTSAGRSPGTLSDVSLDGCFVLSSGDVIDGENVKIFIPLADGMKVEFTGTVTNHVVEIGFGARFDKISSAQRDLLAKLVQEAEAPPG
jgi:hypothetical protein